MRIAVAEAEVPARIRMIARRHRKDCIGALCLVHPQEGRVWIQDAGSTSWQSETHPPYCDANHRGCDAVHVYMPMLGRRAHVCSYVNLAVAQQRPAGRELDWMPGRQRLMDLLAPRDWLVMRDPDGVALQCAQRGFAWRRLRAAGIDPAIRYAGS
jgi:hypothetical protein